MLKRTVLATLIVAAPLALTAAAPTPRHVYADGQVWPGGWYEAIAHLPVSRQTLDSSAVALVASTLAFPDSAAGINQWRTAHGGVFNMPVSEIVKIADQSARGTLGR